MTNRFKLLALLFLCFFIQPAYADCTNPTGKEADRIYNGDYHTYQFCNGSGWIPYGTLGGYVDQSGYAPTVPPGSGYFVLTKTTYTGNLGGLSGANAKCLTELGTTNTTWMGYNDANSRGLLIASKVHAWLCTGTCNNFTPGVTYYVANANNVTYGGASFTADTSGLGPGDNATWSAANYFNGTYTYWTNWNYDYDTKVSGINLSNTHCSSWSSSSSGNAGATGTTSNNAGLRFYNEDAACNLTKNLLCYIDP